MTYNSSMRSRAGTLPLDDGAPAPKTRFMGMDGVEIVMAVEDVFEIQIEDSEAEKILTPRQLIDLVMSKVETTSTDICLTHRSFNLLRQFFVHRCAMSRKQFTPDISLRIAFPRPERRARLQQLSVELAIESPPQLVRPHWLKTSLFGVTSIAGLAAAVPFTHSPIPFWLPTLAAAAATGYIGAVATRNFCTEFPKGLTNIGELARWIMTHKANLAAPQAPSWTRDQVAARVREIVVHILGCDSTYRQDARFIQDLGLS